MRSCNGPGCDNGATSGVGHQRRAWVGAGDRTAAEHNGMLKRKKPRCIFALMLGSAFDIGFLSIGLDGVRGREAI